MKSFTRKSDSSQPAAETAVYLFDDWFDPIEAGVRDRVREFILAMVEGELDAALMRPRYGRRSQSSGDADARIDAGHRDGILAAGAVQRSGRDHGPLAPRLAGRRSQPEDLRRDGRHAGHL